MLKESLQDTTVKDAYDEIVTYAAVVEKGTTLIDAITEMLADTRTHTVYVIDEDERLVGKLVLMDLINVSTTQLDLPVRRRTLKKFKFDFSESVDDLMRSAVTVKEETPITEALQLMEDRQEFDLPVVDDQGKLLGEINGLEILSVVRRKLQALIRPEEVAEGEIIEEDEEEDEGEEGAGGVEPTDGD